jgi:hypothetical protein
VGTALWAERPVRSDGPQVTVGPVNDEPRAHALELEVRRGDGRFRGACECGWLSPWVGAAGVVHGTHAAHVDELEARRAATAERPGD